MSFSDISKYFLHFFSNNGNNIQKTIISNKNKVIFKKFHNLLNKNENYVKNNNIPIKNINFINDKRSVIRRFGFLNTSNIFLSEKIQKNIINQMTSINTFSIKINNILFTINIFLLNYVNKNVDMMKDKIIRLLYFLSNYITNDALKTVEINIIQLDLKKQLPMNNKVLDSYNVNTGVTWACKPRGEIVIYRKEEWFKVLIHELFHSTCLDFSNLNISKSMKNKITELFFIKHCKFDISETYSEFWANTINSILISYEFTNNNFNKFLKQFEMFHTIEKYFSIFQCIKVLHHMNLNYNIITSDRNYHKQLSIRNYSEKTNVFAYYILKMVWLFNINDMIAFFSNRNKNIINSNKDIKYVYDLIELTGDLYKNNKLLSAIQNYSSKISQLNMGLPNQLSTNVELMRSLRMSVIEDEN
jgi:hypothetical protein